MSTECRAGWPRATSFSSACSTGTTLPPPAADDALRRPFRSLTGREAEVFAALVTGAAPKQIAHISGITVSTVCGHIHRVLTKLDVRSQREALAMARDAGWP